MEIVEILLSGFYDYRHLFDLFCKNDTLSCMTFEVPSSFKCLCHEDVSLKYTKLKYWIQGQ